MALPPVEIVLPQKSGPLHRVQFVIEFVGPRSVPAAAAMHLLEPNWHGALGQPNVFVMRGQDLSWQRLSPSPGGSYDSIALAWDLLTAQGNLSSASAKNLLRMAEEFGPYIQRRAMPMPPPPDVNELVKALLTTKEALDIGVTLSLASTGAGIPEKAIWIECSRLGLEFAAGGFDYRSAGIDHPLLTVTPYGDTDAFSLANVQADVRHPGLTVGFHFPTSPAPTQGLEACFRVGDHLARSLGGVLLDENDRPLSERSRQALRSELRSALTLFAQAGITTGSPEAVKLFQEP